MASNEKLQQTWFDFLKSSCQDNEYDSECNHIYGYDKSDNSSEFEISKLQKITAQRILDYEDDVDKSSIQALEEKQKEFQNENGMPLNLLSVIKNKSPTIMTLAAEFKRASPSKGPINASLNAGEQAVIYTKAGASIISVLTETRGFMGRLADLTEARVSTANGCRPAILRKDFIVSEYQILEAVAAGADTVLLIVAILPACLLKRLIDYCRCLNMEPLVEVHTTAELEVALQTGSKVIGVNNRNLHTFSLDLDTTEKVANFMTNRGIKFDHRDHDAEYALCALSGMSSAEDVDRYRQVGVGMVLIGESLMRAADPIQAIRSLCLDPRDLHSDVSVGAAYIAGTKIIKICGVTNVDDALYACQQGANLIGVIFASKSKRKVTVDQARDVVNAVRKFGERDDRILFSAQKENSPIYSLRQNSIRLQQIASKKPLVIGVFQNQSCEFINDVVQQSGIDLIQLHGQEGMEAANVSNYNGVSAIRVVDIPAQTDDSAASSLEDSILSSITSDPFAILLDTTVKHGATGGGTGQTFDWNIVEKIQNKGLPVIIAGGLTPENVGKAVGSVRPFGIDVSSGVEEMPGKKDLEKVRMFVKGARDAAVEASKGI